MPNPVVWLLDKNVVRRAIEGIGASIIAVPLTTEKSEALRLLRWGKRNNVRMMIAPETANILSAAAIFYQCICSYAKSM